jgi:hypothetical protein
LKKCRRIQPLAELERKYLKAVRRKEKLFTAEHLDYAYAWAEDMVQFLSEAGARTAAVPVDLFERMPLQEALPRTGAITPQASAGCCRASPKLD